MKREIASEHKAASCYFRSSLEPPQREALLQITERCNLHCVHCFISAGDYGNTMPIKIIRDTVIPRLKGCRVTSVTLTGGEPFIHPDVTKIVRLLVNAGIRTGICTNGTYISQNQIDKLVEIGNVHLNVSLDGFRPESHGKFRGSKDSFAKTTGTISQLSKYGLLQGLLVTPNNFAEIGEYVELCEFAIQNGAEYVLMNPLSSMGRGVSANGKLRTSDEIMQRIRDATSLLSDHIQIVYIRFPNSQKLPLTSCEAGNIIYVFVNGAVTICPYLVFAAKTPQSLHKPEEFIVGNIFSNTDIAGELDMYNLLQRYRIGDNPTCKNCPVSAQCGKGCPAAVIASGQRIESVDPICPTVNFLRRW